MAVKAASLNTILDATLEIFTWAAMVLNDTGGAVKVPGARSLTAMLEAGGTLGAAGAVKWQGSFDGANWFDMNSDIGTPAAADQIALSTPTMLKERPLYVRPNCHAGDGTTSLVPVLAVGR